MRAALWACKRSCADSLNREVISTHISSNSSSSRHSRHLPIFSTTLHSDRAASTRSDNAEEISANMTAPPQRIKAVREKGAIAAPGFLKFHWRGESLLLKLEPQDNAGSNIKGAEDSRPSEPSTVAKVRTNRSERLAHNFR